MRLKETRPFGQVLADAVVSSTQTLIMIGGFIILFSVITTYLQTFQLFSIVRTLLTPLLFILPISPHLIEATLTGLFELSIVAQQRAVSAFSSLKLQLASVSFILGFNWMSIHAQVASMLAKTDIRYAPYFIARVFHAVLAYALTIVSYDIYFAKYPPASETIFRMDDSSFFSHAFYQISTIGLVITIVSIACAIICFMLQRSSWRLDK